MSAAEPPRDRATRKADTLAKLAGPAADAWVATAAGDQPYLVPLTLAWLRERIVLATEGRSRTARAITATGTARLGLGGTRDVVMIDAVLESAVATGEAPEWVADGYAERADWDPRTAGDGYVFLVLRPDRVQAWREANEISGRTLMRDGRWLE
ncbi:pyridoxamine 5'-phosphate oxidase family protein [Couchioplanes caeruleus]|uniref:pyridoxamine 5'-phosphate oxidase family protein n=1 Tax=Couchioplanes caeruleus TaxID=56438 RepID=UPI0020BFCD50|nr:pyridoxamine 5'-phosphate oxidase family protein [Couchioplanes caeruleus]UQU63132.1 pyridoxamine 5'-phosphate oxidase family protein [Couchioplanes caeruleus]